MAHLRLAISIIIINFALINIFIKDNAKKCRQICTKQKVSKTMQKKLAPHPPAKSLVENYLFEIARTYQGKY